MNRADFVRSAPGVLLGASLTDALLPGLTQDDEWPPIRPEDEHFWTFIRGQFPLRSERMYFNTAGLGASPFAVIKSVAETIESLEQISETGHDDSLWKEIKSQAATLLGCSHEELAFTRNATEGINIVANGFPFERGDEIISTTQEHVGNSLIWIVLQKRIGIAVRRFEPSITSMEENLRRIEALFTPRTRLIAIPHVLTTTGLVLPVREIADLAAPRGIFLFVDGAQTAGMMPMSLRDLWCDAYAASGHKWLMGPKETGLLFMRKEKMEMIEPPFVGAYSDNGFDELTGSFSFHSTAQRYEYGTVNTALRKGLGTAIQFVQRIGIRNVWKRDMGLSEAVLDGFSSIADVDVISPRADFLRSPIVTFRHRNVPYDEVVRRLASDAIRVRPVTEGGVNAVRISTHIYNSPAEVERLVEAVRALS